jgi:hypothetical protein
MSNIILKIRRNADEVRIVAKKGPDVSIHDINLKFIMATLWWEGTPQLETLFEILELTIKRALKEVQDHQKMFIEYVYTSNDDLNEASEINVEIIRVTIDGEEVEVDGDVLNISGSDNRGFFRKLTSFRRKVEETIEKEI